MLRAFLFPQSEYLVTQWWHRLAKVLTVVWTVFVLGYAYMAFVTAPWETCMEAKRLYEIVLKEPSPANCGATPVSAAWSFMHTARGVEDAIAILVALYVALCLPGLLYRVILYIAKGKAWRTVQTA